MATAFKWVGDNLSFTKYKRKYYTAVQRQDSAAPGAAPTHPRVFRTGDTVAVTGEDGKTWIAHIIEFFECREDDPELKDCIIADRQRSPFNDHVLMRCTLRWFYGITDLSKFSLLAPNVPSHIPKEVYFSDHVENDGFNDINVIEGRAFLFESKTALKAFEREPTENFNENADALRIVRCIVDCKEGHLPVRRLRKDELKRLVGTPCKRDDLFHDRGPPQSKAPAPAPATLKATSTKRRPVKRTVTESDEDDEDEEYVQPAPKPVEEEPAEASKSDSDSSPPPRIGRKKVQFNADEQEDSSEAESSSGDDDEPLDRVQYRKVRAPEASASRRDSKQSATRRKERRKSYPTSERRPPRDVPRVRTPPPPSNRPEPAVETFEETHNQVLNFVSELMESADNAQGPRNPLDIGAPSNGANVDGGNPAQTPSLSKKQKKKKKSKAQRKLSTEVHVISSDSDEDKVVRRKSDSRPSAGSQKKTSGSSRDTGNNDARANGRNGGGPGGGKSVFVQNERKKAVAARAGARNALAREGHDGRMRKNGKGGEEASRRKFVAPIGRHNAGKKNGGVSKDGASGGGEKRVSHGVDSDMEPLMNDLTRRFSEISMEGRQVFLKKIPMIMNTLATAMDDDGGRDGRGADRGLEIRLADDLAQTLKMRRVGNAGDGSAGGETPMLLGTS